jgi:O-antigen ligase
MSRAASLLRDGAGPLLGLIVAAGVIVAVFVGTGGSQLPGTTAVELIVLGLGAATLSAAILTGAWPARFRGGLVVLAFVALFALTALSINWSAGPELTWRESSRVLAYLVMFTTGMAAAAMAARRLEWILRGLLLGFTVVCVYALASKVFPGSIAHFEIYARLREPFGYWNASGLAAAYGVVLSLWLGARREAHPLATIGAPPLVVLFATTLMLSYSRGSLLALVVALAVWLVAVPLRIRSAVILILAGLATAPVVAWAFSQDAFSEDRLGLQVRSHTGSTFWIYLMVALLVVSSVGAFLQLRGVSIRASRRQRVGRLLVGGLIAAVLATVVGAAAASGGPGHMVSKAWHDLTSSKVPTPGNDPARLTKASNARTRYWRDAGRMFKRHPWLGVGAGGFEIVRPRYRRDQLDVRHAHGFVPQAAADLGIAGLAVTLLLFLAFLAAAGRAVGGLSRRREGRLDYEGWALVAFVVTFGVHSAIDWTWFVPGVALPALFAAGWLVGLPVAPETVIADSPRRSLGRLPQLASVAGLVAVAVVAALAIVQPLRSSNRTQDAIALAAEGNYSAARQKLHEAHDIDPLAIQPFFDTASVESAAGHEREGEAALEQAVRRNPANPAAWLKLAQYQLTVLDRPSAALETLGGAAYVDPRSSAVDSAYLRALRRAQAKRSGNS